MNSFIKFFLHSVLFMILGVAAFLFGAGVYLAQLKPVVPSGADQAEVSVANLTSMNINVASFDSSAGIVMTVKLLPGRYIKTDRICNADYLFIIDYTEKKDGFRDDEETLLISR